MSPVYILALVEVYRLKSP